MSYRTDRSDWVIPQATVDSYVAAHLPAEAEPGPVHSTVGMFQVLEYTRADGTPVQVTRIDYGTDDDEGKCDMRRMLRTAMDRDAVDHRCQQARKSA